MPKNIDKAVEAIERLVALFKTERIVYMIITVFSVLILLAGTASLIFGDRDDSVKLEVIGMLSSTGGIVYSTGRLLKMWSEAVQLLHKAMEKNDE